MFELYITLNGANSQTLLQLYCIAVTYNTVIVTLNIRFPRSNHE
jgi:hypothetical protein